MNIIYQQHAYEYHNEEEQVYNEEYNGVEQFSGDDDLEKKHDRGGALLNTKKEKMKYMYDQKQPSVPMDEQKKGGEDDDEIDEHGDSVHVSCLA